MTDLDVAVMRGVLEGLIAGHEQVVQTMKADGFPQWTWALASAEAYRTCLELIDRTCEQASVEAVA